MTDPYQPVPYESAPVPSGQTPETRRAAIAVFVVAALIALGALLGVVMADMGTMLDQMNPQDLARAQEAGITEGTIVGFGYACAAGCGVLILGVGVLLAVFVDRGAIWAVITSLVLVGLLAVLSVIALAAMALLPQEAEVPPLNLLLNVVTLAAEVGAVVLLVLALMSRNRPPAAYGESGPYPWGGQQ